MSHLFFSLVEVNLSLTPDSWLLFLTDFYVLTEPLTLIDNMTRETVPALMLGTTFIHFKIEHSFERTELTSIILRK